MDRLRADGRTGDSKMEFGILGPLEVRDGSGVILRVPGGKERALLVDLVVHAGRVVSADRLVEDLWGDAPPGNPANALQGRVSALRRALGPGGAGVVVTSPPGYVLAVDPGWVDAARFEELIAQAGRVDGAEAIGLLEAALGLWRGPALAEFADRPWAQGAAARLEALRLGAVEGLAELRLAAGGQGGTAGLVGELEGLVAAHPTRERLSGLLMVALYRSGRQADALGVYQAARGVLAEELGVDPSPELQRLYQRILVQDPALEAVARDEARHNLPERLTSLIGRDQELGELAKLVELYRLVTVTGAGGAGKSSVAVELGRRVAGGYPDGVWLVELAAVTDPGLVAEVVVAALGLSEVAGEPGVPAPTPAERLEGFVRDKALLVVLDNCEHLVGACAELVQGVLRAGPRVRVLATSREVLGVPGEAVWPVPPLAVPDAAGEEAGVDAVPVDLDGAEVLGRFDAVRLFLERAATADPGFTLTPSNAPVVAELCRRLDGLPLAIELAAARVRALSVAEIAARLDDRFRVLAGGGRTLDPRQQTLRATIDWSWELLAEPDRRLWRRLAVFAGGWTVAAAEAVCGGNGLDPGDVLDGLFGLVDRSLVVAVGGEPARFRLLESLRAYGAERLAEAGETKVVEGRHTGWFLDQAERAAAHRTGRRWLRMVAADYDNLRAVLDRAVADRDPDTALRLAGALRWYWWTAHTIEGRRRLLGVLALADGQPPTPELARVVQGVAMLEMSLTPTQATIDAARRSRELFERFGDQHGAAFSKLVQAFAELQHSGPSAAALRLVEDAGTTFEELGDPWGEAFAGLARLAFESYHRGLPEQAEAAGQRALERFQALDDQWGVAQSQFAVGEFAKARGDLATAEAAYERALAAARDGGPMWVMLASLTELGVLLALGGDDARAAALHAEEVALIRRTGQRRGFGHIYNELGGVARVRGELERARQLHREALPIARELVGWSVPYTLAQLACAEARLGDLDPAAAHLREAAELILVTPQPATAAAVLAGAALVALGRGRPEPAARLLAAAEATRERAGVTPFGAERHEAALAARTVGAALDPDALAAAQAGGRALTAEEALAEVIASA